MNDLISQELRRFILTSIPSVPYLEALLLLRDEPDSAWSSARLAARLYLSEKGATALLAELTSFQIVDSSPVLPTEFHYRPQTEELRKIIDELAAAYSKHLMEVTHLIHSKIDRKAHQFADAFKLRKDS